VIGLGRDQIDGMLLSPTKEAERREGMELTVERKAEKVQTAVNMDGSDEQQEVLTVTLNKTQSGAIGLSNSLFAEY